MVEHYSLAKNIYEHVSAPTRRCSKHNIVKKSKNNYICSKIQEWLVENYSCNKIKASRPWKILDLEHLQNLKNNNSSVLRHIRRKTAQGIKAPSVRMDYFLTQRANTEKFRRTEDICLCGNWRIYPGEAEICKGCNQWNVATRKHY